MRNETPAKTDEKTFSDRSYQHASLYVPAGSWTDYVYGEGYWYKFNKIYETAQSVEDVSEGKAYMLMDDSFGYAVYDPINDKVSLVSSASVDGMNPNHVWMMARVNDKQYLYNLGAKKFAVPSLDGTSFTLTENVASIEAEDGDNGIVLNGRLEKQWNLTNRAQMGGVDDFEEMVTAITTTKADGAKASATYTLDGKQTTSSQRGVRIIHYTDGTTKKVM